MCINQRLLNSLEGCPFPKKPGSLEQLCGVKPQADLMESRRDPHGCSPHPPPQAQPTFQTAGQMTGSPGPSPTHPLSLRETRELLIQALVGMSRGWANAQHVNPLKTEGARQPGAPRAPCPARDPWGKICLASSAPWWPQASEPQGLL